MLGVSLELRRSEERQGGRGDSGEASSWHRSVFPLVDAQLTVSLLPLIIKSTL